MMGKYSKKFGSASQVRGIVSIGHVHRWGIWLATSEGMLIKHCEMCVVDYSVGVFARCDIVVASREMVYRNTHPGGGPPGGMAKKKGTPYRTAPIIIKS